MLEPIVAKYYDVITYGRQVFRVPITENINAEWSILPGIYERRLELSIERGLAHLRREGQRGCGGCDHTGAIGFAVMQSIQDEPLAKVEYLLDDDNPNNPRSIEVGAPVFIERPQEHCRYEPMATDPQWLTCMWDPDNPDRRVAVRMDPCVADTALFIALIEKGHFDSYELQGIEMRPEQYPYRREVMMGGEAEQRAIELYKSIPRIGTTPRNKVYSLLKSIITGNR